MIKLGLVGIGNVAWNVHLPILLSRKDIKLTWVCDVSSEKEIVLKRKNIPFFTDLEEALNTHKCDIVLITVPYYQRKNIFDKIKNNVSGIFFEKPFALSTKEHSYFTKNFDDYEITIGFMRRHMGNVKNIKEIIENQLFGNLKSININFGDVHYNFDGYRSENNKAGGGLFFEAGTHWIDTALFTTNAKKIEKFFSKKKFEDDLDIESDGGFNIIDDKNTKIECKFNFTILKNTSNKMTYVFDNCSIDLFLFEDSSNLIINSNSNNKFTIKNNETMNFPNDSLSVGFSFWDKFIISYKNKKKSEISIDTFLLTSEAVELFYEN
tara:strand:+ start:715 stop:1683 length:969 start_codon:yes stop_codon:yes gene_type:complete